jgi:GldM N-terminal domain.
MKQLLLSAILIFLITACSNKSSTTDQEITKTILESLNNSTNVISHNSDLILHTFEEDLHDPTKQDGAIIWQPKAVSIHNFTSILTKQIDTLINSLTKGLPEGRKDNDDIVYQLFIEKGNGSSLYNSIHSYITQVMNVDSKIQNQFQNHLDLLPDGFDTSNSRAIDFSHIFFEHAYPNQAILMLTGLMNRIIIAENKLLAYCHELFPRWFIEDYTTYSAIIGQNTSYLKGGETLTIHAGVGSFSKRHNEKIFIAGKIIPLDESGIANFSIKVPDKFGSHNIPVRIQYTDQDGKIVFIDKLVKYSVITN